MSEDGKVIKLFMGEGYHIEFDPEEYSISVKRCTVCSFDASFETRHLAEVDGQKVKSFIQKVSKVAARLSKGKRRT